MRTFYFIGIAGSAMASVADALKKQGQHVLGSDSGVYPPMSDFLRQRGIPYFEKYDADNLKDFTSENEGLVVVGNAVSRGNPEVEEVLNQKLPYISLAGLVGSEMISGRTSVVVAGTHGKTTTSALMAWVLEAAGREPGYLIGGIPENFSEGCRTARPGGVFVTEGDEYDTAFFDKRSKFLLYHPDIAIINNVEFDHADIFSSLEEIKTSFRRFVNMVPGNGTLFVNGDDAVAMEVSDRAHTSVQTFGLGEQNNWRASHIRFTDGHTNFVVDHSDSGLQPQEFSIPMAGEFNVRNALAVIAAATALGLTPEEIRQGLVSFKSIKRRMEVIGEIDGIMVIDDFAHHPTAINLTLKALRDKYPERRIWALFEPRSNTTTRSFFQKELAESFGAADNVVIGAVNRPERYAENDRLSTHRLVADLQTQNKQAWALPDADEMVDLILREARSGDVIALLSNGKFGGAHLKIVNGLKNARQ